MWVRSLGWEDPLQEEVATHSSILVWEIPRTEEPGGLQSMGLQTVVPDLVTKQQCDSQHLRKLTPPSTSPPWSYLSPDDVTILKLTFLILLLS